MYRGYGWVFRRKGWLRGIKWARMANLLGYKVKNTQYDSSLPFHLPNATPSHSLLNFAVLLFTHEYPRLAIDLQTMTANFKHVEQAPTVVQVKIFLFVFE